MTQKKPTQLQSKLAEYFSFLEEKKREFIPKQFDTHEDLDQFVANNMQILNNFEKEYLLLHYFMFHLNVIMKEENPLKWECREQNCKLTFLEAYIDEKVMSLHKFKTAKYNFQDSTAF